MGKAQRTVSRPLSPHLGIYRWQLHMAMSILHRATGVFLAAGLGAFAAWLMAIASGPAEFDSFVALASYPVGCLALAGFSFSLIYHALNGIRHLYWDAGHGYELDSVKASGLLVILASIALTAVLWAVGAGWL